MTFHPSLRYDPLLQIKPRAIIFKIASIVKIIENAMLK